MAGIKTVGVLGCGLMGSGIAQVCAEAGYQTIVLDMSSPKMIEKKQDAHWKKQVKTL